MYTTMGSDSKASSEDLESKIGSYSTEVNRKYFGKPIWTFGLWDDASPVSSKSAKTSCDVFEGGFREKIPLKH